MKLSPGRSIGFFLGGSKTIFLKNRTCFSPLKKGGAMFVVFLVLPKKLVVLSRKKPKPNVNQKMIYLSFHHTEREIKIVCFTLFASRFSTKGLFVVVEPSPLKGSFEKMPRSQWLVVARVDSSHSIHGTKGIFTYTLP